MSKAHADTLTKSLVKSAPKPAEPAKPSEPAKPLGEQLNGLVAAPGAADKAKKGRKSKSE